MTKQQTDKLASAVLETFRSVNENDRNFEPANVVDGLFAIARAINHVADATGPMGATRGTTNPFQRSEVAR